MSVQDAIAVNVRRLRSAARLSQSALAEKAGISRYALAKIEKGQTRPQAATLQKLARALGVSLGELVEEVTELRAVRFRARKKMYGREQILADVSRWLSGFREVEDILGESRPFELGRIFGTGSPNPKEAARRVRQRMGLGDEPIRDICGLLETHGIKVWTLSRKTDAFFGLSVSVEDGGPAIVVNTWDQISVERWIFSAAHELGHLLLHLQSYTADEAEEIEDQEREANQFASHFLMPNEVFLREWTAAAGPPQLDRVFKLKRKFRLSYLTVLYRLVENGQTDDRIWAHFRKTYFERTGRKLKKADEPLRIASTEFASGDPVHRKSAEPARLEDVDFKEDRLSTLVRKAYELGEMSLTRAAEILGLTIQEMRTLTGEWVV